MAARSGRAGQPDLAGEPGEVPLPHVAETVDQFAEDAAADQDERRHPQQHAGAGDGQRDRVARHRPLPERISQRDRPEHEQGRREQAEPQQRTRGEGGDGLDDHEVEQDLVDAREAVLGLAELARVMSHLDLGDARAGDGRHRGDEAVHLRVQRYLLDQRPAVGLERATVVLDRHAGDLADEPVGNP